MPSLESIEARNPRVSLSIGITINTGNYQSLKVHISAEVDCLKDEHPTDTLDGLQEYLLGQLMSRTPDIQAYIGV